MGGTGSIPSRGSKIPRDEQHDPQFFFFNDVSRSNTINIILQKKLRYIYKMKIWPFYGFPGGAVVKNPAAHAGNTGSSPGPGRSHMPWSN